jgi:hypothetical protein
LQQEQFSAESRAERGRETVGAGPNGSRGQPLVQDELVEP